MVRGEHGVMIRRLALLAAALFATAEASPPPATLFHRRDVPAG
ncbi:hypothetical protein [Sphingomonas melonis]|nr:hypothetical protein [Sphingomonas melonis]